VEYYEFCANAVIWMTPAVFIMNSASIAVIIIGYFYIVSSQGKWDALSVSLYEGTIGSRSI